MVHTLTIVEPIWPMLIKKSDMYCIEHVHVLYCNVLYCTEHVHDVCTVLRFFIVQCKLLNTNLIDTSKQRIY